jgi:hypothetical protein
MYQSNNCFRDLFEPHKDHLSDQKICQVTMEWQSLDISIALLIQCVKLSPQFCHRKCKFNVVRLCPTFLQYHWPFITSSSHFSSISFMLHSLIAWQRTGDSDSTEFYERRVIVNCGSINKVRQCALCNTEILRVWISDSIMFLNWSQPCDRSGIMKKYAPLRSIVFESNSHLTRIESFAFSSSSLQSILIPHNVEILESNCVLCC